MFWGCELRGIAVLNTVFVVVSWEHCVGCCVANTVLAEFWGNTVRDTDFRYMLSALAVSEAVGNDVTIGTDVPTYFCLSAYPRLIVYACATGHNEGSAINLVASC